jgi:hypothetical protein
MIDIASVLKLSQITHEGGIEKYFSISFRNAEGELRTIEKARRFVKQYREPSKMEKKKSFYNLKDNNCILIFDETKQQTKSIKISRIVKFNGLTVRH